MIDKRLCMFQSHHPTNDRKSGHIINIGSTAAKVYQKGVYCATKHAV
jgi:NADP-dependent 3-hydroxy acid dehydrogenase YdfG